MASPDQIIASGSNLFQYLPQRPPMVMVDTFISSQDKISLTSLTILSDNIFVENGCFTEPGIIENIAQTAAAGLGYTIVHNSHRTDVPIGVIGAIKNLHIFHLPKVDETIFTEVTVVYELMNASVIHGLVKSAQHITIAECEMKIFLVSDQNNNKANDIG